MAYFGKETFTAKKETDKEGHIIILKISIKDTQYILINSYNADTEKEQMNLLSKIFVLLEEFDTNKKTQLIKAEHFNLLFDSIRFTGWESYHIERKESYDIFDIWTV